MLEAGKICFEGTPDELRQSRLPAVSAFIRGETWEPSNDGAASAPGERT